MMQLQLIELDVPLGAQYRRCQMGGLDTKSLASIGFRQGMNFST